MQEPTPQSRRHISHQIVHARKRFREIRQNFTGTFRKHSDKGRVIPSSSPGKSRQLDATMDESGPEPSPSLSREPSFENDPGDTIMDGAADRGMKRGLRSNGAQISAIFIHAGAGYHSSTNEHIHLAACDDAAKLAMRVLRAGGSAVDAVETAIKVLEDKEITNAGYGSNLSIDGVVECDATIVDYLGRSGACGATAQVKNPINLARLILELSTKPLSLRRVPPNLLVGQGATDFAWEHGIPVVPHDMIVSKNAQDRFLRWREDLRRADGRMTPASSNMSGSQGHEEEMNPEYEEQVRKQQRRDHVQALLNSTWNEGQPDSPGPTTPSREILGHNLSLHSPTPSTSEVNRVYAAGARNTGSSNRGSLLESPAKKARYNQPSNAAHSHSRSLLNPNMDNLYSPKSSLIKTDGPSISQNRVSDSDGAESPVHGNAYDELVELHGPGLPRELTDSAVLSRMEDDDMITDTVGAIAVDMYGHIAAGSSSGGIGMKHRGRVGPAALVGVGSAVLPVDERDAKGVSVAAVTSGTGEHMATTMASQKCAERLYHNTRRARGGGDIEATEEEALESFIQADFMGHPGVKDSISAGAIGVMAVKKTPSGYFLYFAHNTDSFALASMHSNEKEPKCVMSRLGEQGSTVQGARKIRVE